MSGGGLAAPGGGHHAGGCARSRPRARCQRSSLPQPRAARRLARHAAPRDAPAAEGGASTSGRREHLDAVSPDELLGLLRSKQPGSEAGVGTVYLVGTGPGDPGLLTLRALQLMQTADVVLYDRLVSDDILRLVHGGARMVYVGKQRGFHTRAQGEIHELLRAFAGGGGTVLRLKGGDPFVFGRGGEEQQYLQALGVRTVVVPGITAASGIAAELGIPLTHRGLANSVRFLTGHMREGGEAELDTTAAACRDPHTTLVVYMGLSTLPALAAQLTAAGLPPDTPAAAVERGTTPEQRVVFSPLARLQGAVAAAALQSPTLLLIGAVVALSPGWAAYRASGRALQLPGDWAPAAAAGAAAAQVAAGEQQPQGGVHAPR